MRMCRGLAIAFVVMGLPVVSEAPALGAGQRVLQFPKDRSLGKVSVCEPVPDRPLEGFFFWIRGEDWKYLADARGDVAVPADKWVGLTIEQREAWSDLSPLRDLQPDDLYQLGVHGSYCGGPRPGDACMPYIAHLTGLRVLDMSSTNATGAGMKCVTGLRSLKRLTAPDRMDDTGLAQVAKLPALTGLYLQESRVTNTGLKHLAGLPALEELALAGRRLTDDGLIHLSKLPRLRYLMLKGDGFSDAGFIHLQSVPSLRILHLGLLPQTTDAGLAHLSKLVNVQDVTFRWSPNITNEGVRYLSGLPHLRSLDVARSKVTDAGLAYLKDVKTLESLWLPAEGISDLGLEYLSRLPQLHSLHVSRAYRNDTSQEQGYYTDEGIQALAHCRFLEELDVGSIGMTDASLDAIATLDNLRNLTLFGCTSVTDEGLKELGPLKSLEVLTVHRANVTISGMSGLNGLSNLRHLRVDGVAQDYSGLDLSGLERLEHLTIGTRREGGSIRDTDVACLARLTRLESFQIVRPAIQPPALTDNGLASLAGLTKMDRLTIGGPDLTDEGLAHLRRMKRLDMLNIYGGTFTDRGLKHLEQLDALAYLTLVGEHRFTQKEIRHLFETLPHLSHVETGPKDARRTILRQKILTGASRR